MSAAGFDDIESMVHQMTTPVPINESMLKNIGIRKPGHYKRLLMRLTETAIREKREDVNSSMIIWETFNCSISLMD